MHNDVNVTYKMIIKFLMYLEQIREMGNGKY